MAFELTKEQRWEIFNSLPESLKEAIFSADTADAISNICLLHNVSETTIIAKIVGNVLMGLLPPQRLSENIKEKLPLASEAISNTVAIELQHYIFDPIMEDIMSLYTQEKVDELDKQNEELQEKPSEGKDLYREKIIE